MTHISYKTAKRLKEFLGESAPEPMGSDASEYDNDGCVHSWINILDNVGRNIKNPDILWPRYQLHDLLSKPFCEAMENKGVRLFSHTIVLRLADMYYDGGLRAVEAALMEMMEAK